MVLLTSITISTGNQTAHLRRLGVMAFAMAPSTQQPTTTQIHPCDAALKSQMPILHAPP